MKIVLTIATLGAGGAERVLVWLANQFVLEHQIIVLTLDEPAKSFYPFNPGIELIQFDELNKENISFLDKIIAKYRRLKNLRRHIKTLQPHLIISFIDIMNVSVLLASIGLSVPVMVCERTDPKYHKISWLARFLRKILYPQASHIVVQTQTVKKQFPKKLFSKISVIANPILAQRHMDSRLCGNDKRGENTESRNDNIEDRRAEGHNKNSLHILPPSLEIIQPSLVAPVSPLVIQAQAGIHLPQGNAFKILSVGRLSHEKGFDILIQSFVEVIKDFPHTELFIYGEGQARSTLEKLLDAHQLKEKVFLPGVVSNISDIYQQADLFILPSRYEGFPNVLLEAMRAKMPVLVSDIAVHQEILGDCKQLLFEKENSQALSAKVRQAVSDINFLKSLTRYGSIVEKFSEEQILKQWQTAVGIRSDKKEKLC